ncbi:E3 ubiquitin-protein ligase WAV3-like [Triticum dicoccoides]|uniref:E3 ubiquitin-protein ligase WAV3-like n=1 Tax=Triticum dicoccoides TaxID=85692 RepID=UPI0018906604|nr:E3 ubiquitin-protein ligase WAV3-like [Triticum dicoccoides]
MADADADADVCAICLGAMVRGQAGFTAECSHAFHLRCISASVAHGNHDCPLCKAPWTVLPAVNAPLAPPSSSSSSSQQLVRRAYQDDEPTVPAQAAAENNGGSGAAAVVLRTHCEVPALARGAARENFAVLVHAKAPSSEAARASLDLVTVLDVSGSMAGSKLALLKRAMGFVMDNLGPADRLSVVSFSNNASRLIRLARMSDAGKAAAKQAVESLFTNGGTNIGEGLRVAADVLDCRRHMNAVASIMLLSDGQDTYNGADYITLVPPSLRGYNGAGVRPPAVHTFGFGTDHDAAAMHTIAEATGGTFSFIQNQAIVQDAFAQCIGGLLTVVVQEARIAVTCLHPGVRVREVKSGRYDSHVDADGRASSVDVGELYADEERRFLLLMDVPTAEDAEEVTGLLKVSCTYQDAATGQAATVDGDDAVVQRPVEATEVEPSMEVERERLRVAATEDMAAAREAADRGEHAEGGRILRRRLGAMKGSARAHKDLDCEELEDEMHDFIGLVEDRQQYQKFGHARILSGMSSHRNQRAATLGKPPGGRGGRGRGAAYATPAMKKMVDKSREQRQTAAAPAPQPKRKHGRGQQPDSKSGTGKRHKKH